MLMDFDPAVRVVSSQPFWLHWHDERGRARRHAPDFFVRRDHGAAVVIDVRPDDRIPGRDAEAFTVTASACELAGWEFRRVGELDPVLTANGAGCPGIGIGAAWCRRSPKRCWRFSPGAGVCPLARHWPESRSTYCRCCSTWCSRAQSRRYLQSGFGRLRCSRRGCFVCFLLRDGPLPEHCLRRRPRANPLVAAVFRTKWLLGERRPATCQRRRRPGQARRRRGRLQITADRRGRKSKFRGVGSRPYKSLVAWRTR